MQTARERKRRVRRSAVSGGGGGGVGPSGVRVPPGEGNNIDFDADQTRGSTNGDAISCESSQLWRTSLRRLHSLRSSVSEPREQRTFLNDDVEVKE